MELSAEQAARIIGVSRPTIHVYVKRGLLPARRQGLRRAVRINIDDLRFFAEGYGYNIDEEIVRRLADTTGQGEG